MNCVYSRRTSISNEMASGQDILGNRKTWTIRIACAASRSSFALSPSAKHAIPSTMVPCRAEIQISSILLLKESRALFSQGRPRSARGMDANAAWLEKLIASTSQTVRTSIDDLPGDQCGHSPNQIGRCLAGMILCHKCRRVEQNVLLVMDKVKIDLHELSDQLLIWSIIHGQR